MPPRAKSSVSSSESSAAGSYFALVLGLFLALNLIKWGNPVVLDMNDPPKDLLEWIYFSWPVQWSYLGVVPVIALGLFAAFGAPRAPGAGSASSKYKWLPWLPLFWFLWQCVSATQTVDRTLTELTLKHFAILTTLFYLGYFGLRDSRNHRLIWVCLTLGLFCVLRAGFEQHFGGLEAARKMFYHDHPDWQTFPPEYIKRVNSSRIYGTLGNPNSLAGVVLLLLPIALTFLWAGLARFSIFIRRVVVCLAALAGLAALGWSGSKAGWLIAVAIGMLALWHSAMPRAWKRILLCTLLVAGLAGFIAKYAGFFERGSTSVVARFDYWTVGLKTAAAHPVLGTGPGTFFVEYKQLKRPEAEMTRLCHNDYLEQACDSGLPGFLAFTLFIGGSLVLFYRQLNREFNLVHFGVWLGLLGWALHSIVDFHLYVPALAWTAFLLLGWAWGGMRNYKL